MAVRGKLIELGILVLSIGAGLAAFYFWSDLPKKKKRAHINEMASQLINFIIFIWIGKILLNFSLFLSDPFAVLAYPSDAKAFYVAIVFITLLFIYKAFRKKENIFPIIESFLPVFLVSSFVYEFIELIVKDNPYAFGSIILYSILIALYYFLQKRIRSEILFIVLITFWSVCMVLLLAFLPFVSIFGYSVGYGFVGLFLVISIGTLSYKLVKNPK